MKAHTSRKGFTEEIIENQCELHVNRIEIHRKTQETCEDLTAGAGICAVKCLERN